MIISHLFTINDIEQLGKYNQSYDYYHSSKKAYLGGVPDSFHQCFKEIYEEFYKSEDEEYNEMSPIEKPIVLTPSPCSTVSKNHSCHDYCKWHKSLFNSDTLTYQEFLALMKLSQPQRKVVMEPINDAEWNLTMKVFGDANSESKKKTENLQDFASMPFVIFCKDRVDKKWQGDDIGMTSSFCSDFYPTPTDQGICMTKNLNFKDMIDFSSDFTESFKGNREKSGELVQSDRLTAKATFVLYTNAGSTSSPDPGYGIKTFSKSKSWDKRREDIGAVQFQIHSPGELPHMLIDPELDEDLNAWTVNAGIEYTIDIEPVSQKITEKAKKLEFKDRECLLESEIPAKSALKRYTEQNCKYECKIKHAMEKCSCVSWDFPLNNNKNGMQECDVFGRTCFSRAMQKFSRVEKDMCPDCRHACEYTSYHKIGVKEVSPPRFIKSRYPNNPNVLVDPCWSKDFCDYLLHSNGSIDSNYNDWMIKLSKQKVVPDLRKFADDHIVIHIKFPSAKIEETVLDARYTLYEKLALLGGELSLCEQMTGASILTFIHLVVLIFKASWNCYAARKSDPKPSN